MKHKCGKKHHQEMMWKNMHHMHGHHHGHHHHGRHEGKFTKAIESQTSKVPSGFFLGAAMGAMATSLAFKCCRYKHSSLFVGQWAAPLLIMGLYGKMVKQHGHD